VLQARIVPPSWLSNGGRSAPPPLDGDFSTGIETKPARCRHARLSDARATSD
jgi:hypothetical protein